MNIIAQQLSNLIKGISANKDCLFAGEYRVSIDFYEDEIEVEPIITLERYAHIDSFKYTDYRNQLTLLNCYEIGKHFEILNFFDMDDTFEEVYVRTTNYQKALTYKVKQTEQSKEDRNNYISVSLVISIANNSVTTKLIKFIKCPQIEKTISQVEDYYNAYKEIVNLVDETNFYIDFIGFEEDKKIDYLKEFKQSYQTLKDENYFKVVLSDVIGKVDEDVFLFSNRTSNYLVIEHIGCNFNHFVCPKVDDLSVNVIHSTFDKLYNPALSFEQQEKDRRTIKHLNRNIHTATVSKVLNSYTRDCFTKDIYSYASVKLSLAKGLISEIIFKDFTILGLNEQNEVVFRLIFVDEDLIINLNQLKNRLNNLIKDFNESGSK